MLSSLLKVRIRSPCFSLVKNNQTRDNIWKFAGPTTRRHYHLSAARSIFSFSRLFLWTSGTVGIFITYKVTESYNWLLDMRNDAVSAAKYAMADFQEIFQILKIPDFFGDILPYFNIRSIQNAIRSSLDEYSHGTTASVMHSSDDNTHASVTDSDSSMLVNQSEFGTLIKKMNDIRLTLKMAGYTNELNLPRIVVIGSQSSGKSSVLESLIGHDFLPKGSNMITRRPLELTLVNDQFAKQDTAIFESGVGKSIEKGLPISDFSIVKNILVELNAEVPENEYVSDVPIGLTIRSANVPDLCLVDLPGYIQIHNRSQPSTLREKISNLCQKYIQDPNIILAVSAADVDLANSESLKASRTVDPEGYRTIGVITKMDLIDPVMGRDLITKNEYPLQQGYIGVICNPIRINRSKCDIEQSYSKLENLSYIFGISALKSKLIRSLENVLLNSIDSMYQQVALELDEMDYQFKVRYNDRNISVSSYISSLLNFLHDNLRLLADNFNRASVQKLINNELESRLLDIYEKYIWNSENIISLNNVKVVQNNISIDPSLEDRLQRALVALTQCNLGRITSSLLLTHMRDSINSILQKDPYSYHRSLTEQLQASVEEGLRSKSTFITSQIENVIKPHRYGTEFSLQDWHRAAIATISLLKETLKKESNLIGEIKREIGSVKLSYIQSLLGSHDKNDMEKLAELQMRTPFIVQRAIEATQSARRADAIRLRLDLLKSKSPCKVPQSQLQFETTNKSLLWKLLDWLAFWKWNFSNSSKPNFDPKPYNLMYTRCDFGSSSTISGKNSIISPFYVLDPPGHDRSNTDASFLVILRDPCQYLCPEIYLHLLLTRLVRTATPYLHHELIENFLLHGVSERLAGILSPNYSESSDSMESKNNVTIPTKLALENPIVAAQLFLQTRRLALQQVKEKLSIMKLTYAGDSDIPSLAFP